MHRKTMFFMLLIGLSSSLSHLVNEVTLFAHGVGC